MKVLLTSGGTKVPIDRVRHIGNMSHGTFGSKIARSWMEDIFPSSTNPELHFIYAKHSKTPFSMEFEASSYSSSDRFIDDLAEFTKLRMIYKESHARNAYFTSIYRNYDEYSEILENKIKRVKPDITILAAAVSDYLVENVVDGKIRSTDDLKIELSPATKLISKVREWYPDTFLVGFKLLVDSTDKELIDAAHNSILKNQCNMVVANDLRDILNDEHRLLIVKPNKKVEEYKSIKENPNYLAQQLVKDIYWTYCKNKKG